LLSAELLAALVSRLKEARSKGRLGLLLKRIKEEQDVPRRKFRSSGTIEQLREAVGIAAADGLISVKDLASLVDDVEENGGQHIFLFNLTEAGKQRARSQAFKGAFQALPAQATPAMYAELPSAKRTYLTERATRIVVKQISRAEYWEKDEDRSYSRADERATFIVRRQRRAINLLLLDPVQGRAEVRIDRVRSLMDDGLALTLFSEFQNDLQDAFAFASLTTPVPIWQGFTRIVSDRANTYMSTDGAKDASVTVNISNRREADRGTDVRDHPTYAYATRDYTRDTLNVYWLQEGKEKVHTILSRVPDANIGKIYVAAKIDADQLAYVIERIRQSTLDAP
jgi:hypothetical protein